MILPLVALLLTADPSAAEDSRYELDASRTTAQVSRGDRGQLDLVIRAVEGYYVSLKAPLKITLEAEGLSLEKSKLGAKDAKEESASPAFQVGFAAEQVGRKQIAADVSFFLCSEKICERQRAKLSVPVEVKPGS